MPPTIPLRPNGITTILIIPQRVAPKAIAPSRSPIGACEKTSRMIEVTVGSTTTPTAIPAMNADEVYDDGESGTSTRRKGSNPPKCTDSHCGDGQQVRLEEEQRPHRVDDRRHRGHQVDEA